MKHSEEFLHIVNDAKSRVKEVSVDETLTRINAGANLIDVREDNEFEAGHAKDSIHLARGIIERDIVEKFPDKDSELILYCGGGYRSALSADMLQNGLSKRIVDGRRLEGLERRGRGHRIGPNNI